MLMVVMVMFRRFHYPLPRMLVLQLLCLFLLIQLLLCGSLLLLVQKLSLLLCRVNRLLLQRLGHGLHLVMVMRVVVTVAISV